MSVRSFPLRPAGWAASARYSKNGGGEASGGAAPVRAHQHPYPSRDAKRFMVCSGDGSDTVGLLTRHVGAKDVCSTEFSKERA